MGTTQNTFYSYTFIKCCIKSRDTDAEKNKHVAYSLFISGS